MTPVVVVLAILLALLLRAVAVWRGRRERARLADPRVIRLLVGEPSPIFIALRGVALAVGIVALGLAVLGGSEADEDREDPAALETVLVLDASNSMLAEDLVPNRLAVQQQLARQLIMQLPGRIGIVYFAGRGYVLSPLTTDRDAALMYAESVHPAVVGRGGSAIASGLTQALQVLEGGEEVGTRKSIVLLSDGEVTEGNREELFEAVDRAARAGVEVHAIGLGTADGGRISAAAAVGLAGRQAGPPGSFLRGPDGEIVMSRLEHESLEAIARETGGAYEEAGDDAVRRIVSRISLAGSEDRPKSAGAANLFLLLAFLALWAEGFVATRA
ncbi:MAG: VWA domain-containing protein [Gemmatimonadota bacterium]|jgi:Ca-activated chloride channel family protein|nr:MAG: VWA domain-containing protein [Gemmatimonadota bacterium]